MAAPQAIFWSNLVFSHLFPSTLEKEDVWYIQVWLIYFSIVQMYFLSFLAVANKFILETFGEKKLFMGGNTFWQHILASLLPNLGVFTFTAKMFL